MVAGAVLHFHIRTPKADRSVYSKRVSWYPGQWAMGNGKQPPRCQVCYCGEAAGFLKIPSFRSWVLHGNKHYLKAQHELLEHSTPIVFAIVHYQGNSALASSGAWATKGLGVRGSIASSYPIYILYILSHRLWILIHIFSSISQNDKYTT